MRTSTENVLPPCRIKNSDPGFVFLLTSRNTHFKKTWSLLLEVEPKLWETYMICRGFTSRKATFSHNYASMGQSSSPLTKTFSSLTARLRVTWQSHAVNTEHINSVKSSSGSFYLPTFGEGPPTVLFLWARHMMLYAAALKSSHNAATKTITLPWRNQLHWPGCQHCGTKGKLGGISHWQNLPLIWTKMRHQDIKIILLSPLGMIYTIIE